MSDAAAMDAEIEARFSSLELIGRGSFGDVYKGFDKELGKEVAIKVIDLEEAEDDIEDIQKEISVLSQCRSSYITEYYGSYLHQTKLWILMEYMAGGSVADLVDIFPERPKIMPSLDIDTPEVDGGDNSESTGTVRVLRNTKDDGAESRNSGWDLKNGASQGTGTIRATRTVRSTGTVRSTAKPPQFSLSGEKRPDSSYNQVPPRTSNRGNQFSPTHGSVYNETSSSSEARYQNENMKEPFDASPDNWSEDAQFSSSSSGTVVVRSPKELQMKATTSRIASSEDAYGTVVLHSQPNEPETPHTPKSRLGILERSSSAMPEDSTTNLAEAKAALQGGVKKGSRERSAVAKNKKKSVESSPNPDSSRDTYELPDAQRIVTRSHPINDVNESYSKFTDSPVLSMLIIPSLKEAIDENSEGLSSRSAVEALRNLEHQKPGTCQLLLNNILQRLGSSKETSFKGLQEQAAQIFAKNHPMSNVGSNCKKHVHAEAYDSPNLTPLARFLMARWQGQVSRDLSST